MQTLGAVTCARVHYYGLSFACQLHLAIASLVNHPYFSAYVRKLSGEKSSGKTVCETVRKVARANIDLKNAL